MTEQNLDALFNKTNEAALVGSAAPRLQRNTTDYRINDNFYLDFWKGTRYEINDTIKLYLSKRNADYIQSIIRRVIHKKVGKDIGRQNDLTLAKMMLSVYQIYGKNYDHPDNIRKHVLALDKHVVEKACKEIINNIIEHNRYINECEYDSCHNRYVEVDMRPVVQTSRSNQLYDRTLDFMDQIDWASHDNADETANAHDFNEFW